MKTPHDSVQDALTDRSPRPGTEAGDAAGTNGAQLFTGRAYWRSIEERAGSPEFRAALEREFPMGAAELSDGIDRRTFIQLLGSSLALSGLAGCPRAPPEKILPYTRQPPDLTPGNPLHYATALSREGYATGVLATS